MSAAKEPVAQDPNQEADLNEPSHEDDVISSDNLYSRQRRRGFLMLVLYFLVALAFAVLVVLFGRWVYHRVHKSSNPAPAGNTTTPAPATSNTPTQSNNSANPSSNSSSTPSTPSGTPTQTPNTGPGDVVAIFIGTAVIVGGLHFIYSVRRAS